MATRAKDSTTPSRERKSSTSPAPTRTKRPSKPTTPDRPSSTSTSTSPSPTKPVPNYLKSTASSSRHTPDSSSVKPTLNRRRSFDKPPSPSRLRKSLISPGKESKEATLRSKSFTTKTATTTAPKPGAKTGSGTKPQALFAKSSGGGTSLRRSTSGVTSGASKKESIARSSNGGSKAPKSQHITEILNLEANFDDSEVGDVDKIESIEEDNSEDLPDPKISEEEHDDDHHQSDADQDKSPTGHDTSSEHEISSVKDAEEQSKPIEDAKPEEVIQEEKTSDVQHDQVEENIHEGSEEGSGLAGEETKDEEVIKDEDKCDEVVEVAVVDDGRSAEADAKEEAKAEEAVLAEETAKPQPAPAQAAAKNKKEAAHGAYNDVIEETASKLMASDQKRKNKVLALVGAFETVIDYETAAGGSK